MQTRIDWKFAALCIFVGVGSLGGWLVLGSCAWELWQEGTQEPLQDEIARVGMQGGWEPIGRDPDGTEYVKRVASNGDRESVMIMPNGTGLYMRCPTAATPASECVKIVLRPRQ